MNGTTPDDSLPHPAEPPSPAETPAIEDGETAESPPVEPLAEDDLELLDGAGRSLEPAAALSAEPPGEAMTSSAAAVAASSSEKLETSDVGSMPEEPSSAAAETPEPEVLDVSQETSAHRIVVELKRIESEVRDILEGRDSRRKRKLGGTRRWLELEEDIIQWHYASRFDEPTLQHLRELVSKRHHLFKRLRFIAGTRATWNT